MTMATDVVSRVLSEDLCTFAEVTKMIREQQSTSKMHVSTVHRWCLRGVKGHKLESVRVGGRLLTSRQAVHRFLNALNTDA